MKLSPGVVGVIAPIVLATKWNVVQAQPTTVLSDDFELAADETAFTTFSEPSTDGPAFTYRTWDGSGAVQGNGFGAINGGEAYLITTAPLNFYFLNAPELYFTAQLDFDGPLPEVVYSTDWDGSTSSSATWTSLYVDSGSSRDYAEQGPIALSAIPGQTAYIGWRYTSLGGSSGQSVRYTISEMRIEAVCGFDFGSDGDTNFPPAGWTVINDDEASFTWFLNSDGQAEGGNFGSPVNGGAEDYLVSPEFAVATVDEYFVSFQYTAEFSDSIDSLKVLVTEEWTGDTTTTTWTDVTPDGLAELDSFTVNNLQSKLIPFTGTTVRVAFLFLSSGTQGGETRNILIDHVCVDKLGGDLQLVSVQKDQAGASVTLTPLTTGGRPPLTYTWDFTSMGLGTSTEQKPSIFNTVPGTFAFTAEVTDATNTTLLYQDTITFQKYNVPQQFGDLRVATFNVLSFSSFSDGLGLYDALQDPTFEGAKQFASVLQSARPDMILVNEYDHVWIDSDTFDETRTLEGIAFLQENFLSISQLGDEPIQYDYVYVAPCNTGVQSGFDLDNDGRADGPGDGYGFGDYPGRYAQIFLSQYPIDFEKSRTFQTFLWKDMPGAFLPTDPNDADGNGDTSTWYTAEELDIFRLSSKSHWDIVVNVNGQEIHCLCSHPTPPVFDDGTAEEYPSTTVSDWNGLRNHDEIRFWADYIDPALSGYIYDDDGQFGGLEAGAKFVILGDQNADPIDGDATFNPMLLLLNNPLVNSEITPISPGSLANEGKPEKTATFGLRADYSLPSATLPTSGAFTFWLADETLIPFYASSSSDHFYVSSDVVLAETFPIQKIHEIQGAGPSSPWVGSFVRISAIVTGVFPALGGFFLQEEDADADNDIMTSEGIFVDYSDEAINIGDNVLVSGYVNEDFGETQIKAVSVAVQSSGNDLPAFTNIELLSIDTATVDGDGKYQPDLEAYESMLVNFPETLMIAEQFQLVRFNEIKLVAGERPVTFTQLNRPDPVLLDAHLEALGRRCITYDDALQDQQEPIGNLEGFGPVYTTANAKRMGDTIINLHGVLSYSWAGNSASGSTWRVRSNGVGDLNSFETSNPRPEVPDVLEGVNRTNELKFVGLNVLNFFTTLDVSGSPGSGPDGAGPRGADNQEEYDRQLEKLVTTILAMDTDIFGLNELENEFGDQNGDGLFAIGALVDALNAAQMQDTYKWVDPGVPFVGGDAIANGFIYRSSAGVTLIGSPAILDSSVDPRFIDTKNRPAVAATFSYGGNCITLANNHLKSKGSDCSDVGDPDPVPQDGTGSCNMVRSDAALALADWLKTDPTDSGCELAAVIGDLNSYASEDPIMVLEEQGYTNVKSKEEYSYVFDGQVGTLDYVLANDALLPFISGAASWHVNEDEATALDYNTDFGRDKAIFDGTVPWRNSDHSPIVVGINFDPILDSTNPTTSPTTNPTTSPTTNPTTSPTTNPTTSPTDDSSASFHGLTTSNIGWLLLSLVVGALVNGLG